MFRNHRRGLTPSETLMVATLVAAIVLVVTWRLAGDPTERQRSETIERMRQVMDALERYAIDNGGVFPSTEEGLQRLVEPPTENSQRARWNGPYLDDLQALYDAWGARLQYVAPESSDAHYHLWSNGADRAEGGEGADADIQSWNRSTMIP